MSVKESRRVYVIEQAVNGKITNRQAAEVLNLSERQVIRLKERMKAEGIAGLAHKNRGQTPKHAVPKEIKEKVAMLAQGPLRDASCQQVAELLKEFYAITLSAKTVGRILKGAGVPLAHTHRPPKRQRSRDRMPQEGLLSQVDASPFAWLEGRGPENFQRFLRKIKTAYSLRINGFPGGHGWFRTSDLLNVSQALSH